MGGTHLRSKGHALCASRLAVHSGYPVLIYKRHDKEGGVFAAKLTFVSPMYLLHSARDAIPPQRVSDDSLLLAIFLLDFGQPSDYPLSPFKMKFEPPLFHPNSEYSRTSSTLTSRSTNPPIGSVACTVLHVVPDHSSLSTQSHQVMNE